MERQLEFEFTVEENIRKGKTCNVCKNCDANEGICKLDFSEVSGDHSCPDFEHDDDQAMRDIEEESRKAFEEIMDEYSVPENVRIKIHNHCRWF
jgi:hypothetical protein